MKITAPKNPDEYFRQTDHAVKHSYAGLDSCWQYYQEALQHWDISQIGQRRKGSAQEGVKGQQEQGVTRGQVCS